jgi:hypothetical protein
MQAAAVARPSQSQWLAMLSQCAGLGVLRVLVGVKLEANCSWLKGLESGLDASANHGAGPAS